MFGCIKRLIEISIIILAVIGFYSINGDEVVKDLWEKYKSRPTASETELSAKKISNFTLAGDDYKFVKKLNLMGYNIILIEYEPNEQKIAVMECEDGNQELIAESDLYGNKAESKIEEISRKLRQQHIRLKNIKIIDNNGKPFTNGKIKYVQFEAGVESLPFDKIKGALAVHKNANGKNQILVSANILEEYSQEIADYYFKKTVK